MAAGTVFRKPRIHSGLVAWVCFDLWRGCKSCVVKNKNKTTRIQLILAMLAEKLTWKRSHEGLWIFWSKYYVKTKSRATVSNDVGQKHYVKTKSWPSLKILVENITWKWSPKWWFQMHRVEKYYKCSKKFVKSIL